MNSIQYGDRMEKEAGLRIGHDVTLMACSTSLCLNLGYGVHRYKQLVWIEVHGKETNRGNEYLGTLREYSTEYPIRIPDRQIAQLADPASRLRFGGRY